ncbi:MAG: alpha/beta hydrolase [Hyphomicrobiales bacterium]
MITAADGHIVEHTLKEVPGAKKICILAHGITADRSEGGIFDRQAHRLQENGISTLQIDFRGHGQSNLDSHLMTIEGEVLDLQASINSCAHYSEVVLLAASFAGVSTGLLSDLDKSRISKLCLWNPVVSLERTFVKPELPWQLSNFGKDKLLRAISEDTTLLIDGAFAVGPKFLKEVQELDAEAGLRSYTIPVLVVHGNEDTYVSYDIAKSLCSSLPSCSFVSVEGSEHGFGRPTDEALALQKTTDFFMH